MGMGYTYQPWGLQNRWNLLQLLKHWLKIILLYSLYITRSNNTKYGCVYTLLNISTTKLKIFNVYLFQKVEMAAIFNISVEFYFSSSFKTDYKSLKYHLYQINISCFTIINQDNVLKYFFSCWVSQFKVGGGHLENIRHFEFSSWGP